MTVPGVTTRTTSRRTSVRVCFGSSTWSQMATRWPRSIRRRRYEWSAWWGIPHIGIRRPFATGRLVRVSWSSRATRWASSKNASKKSPRRKSRMAVGC